VSDLIDAIDAHHRSDTRARRIARARAQILSLAQTRLRTHPALEQLAVSVADGTHDAYTAAELLLGQSIRAQCPEGGADTTNRID
jgi:LAO/AO transport system kinase